MSLCGVTQSVVDVMHMLSVSDRFRTKLVASVARCRIKHELLTLDSIVPEKIRRRQERAMLLPLYGWINSLRSRSLHYNHVWFISCALNTRDALVSLLHCYSFYSYFKSLLNFKCINILIMY